MNHKCTCAIALAASLFVSTATATATAAAAESDSPWWKQGFDYLKPTQAEKLEDASEDHEENVDEFRESTVDLADRLKNRKERFLVFKAALQASNGEHKQAHKLLAEWETVADDVDELRDTFDSLTTSSENYFQEASARAMQIGVAGLRKDTLEAIREGRSQYQKRLHQTRQRMSQLARSTNEAEALIIALEVNVSLRHVIAEANAGFDQIEARIDGVLSSLERLTKDGKDLLTFEVI